VNFAAEVTASLVGESGPIEFFFDGLSVGILNQTNGFSATNGPISVPLVDIGPGIHSFSVRDRGANGDYCDCREIISVPAVKLGIKPQSIICDSELDLEVVTTYPGKKTIIESSANLFEWVPISTNVPTSNYFDFTNAIPPGAATQWYRAVIPDTQ
jgi:hypothetical protein